MGATGVASSGKQCKGWKIGDTLGSTVQLSRGNVLLSSQNTSTQNHSLLLEALVLGESHVQLIPIPSF